MTGRLGLFALGLFALGLFAFGTERAEYGGEYLLGNLQASIT
jgi:hypothetical protein